jgi:hypothetical protein
MSLMSSVVLRATLVTSNSVDPALRHELVSPRKGAETGLLA